MITELCLPVTHCRAKNDAILAGQTGAVRSAITINAARWNPSLPRKLAPAGRAESIFPRPLGEIKIGRSEYIALRRNQP